MNSMGDQLVAHFFLDTTMADPFPAEDFDEWAEHYDQSVSNTQSFPFTGYEDVLDKVVEIAASHPGMKILDLGIGTGNLALRFDALGCEIWRTNFSPVMLEKARHILPTAHLFTLICAMTGRQS